MISIAPMMDYTDRHCRYFLRLMAPSAKLYTEMVTSHALIHGDVKKILAFHPAEKYLALQLGGSDPKQLAYCVNLGEELGYDEINLNVGCPSAKVKSGQFGACLMLNPLLVAHCVAEMQAKTNLPITIKCRIGVDDQDSYEDLQKFIALMAEAGCKTIIIHARKAWLKGLSPKQNREVPPLRYDIVYQIKKNFPQLQIIINGGIKTIEDIRMHLRHVDGVMIGRAAYSNPYLLAKIQNEFYPNTTMLSRAEVVEKMLPYIQNELNNGVRLQNISRHLLGLFQGQSKSRLWRRYISEHAHQKNANVEIITQALQTMLS